MTQDDEEVPEWALVEASMETPVFHWPMPGSVRTQTHRAYCTPDLPRAGEVYEATTMPFNYLPSCPTCLTILESLKLVKVSR